MELTESESIVLDYCLSYFPYYGDFSLMNKIDEADAGIVLNPDLKSHFDSLNGDCKNIHQWLVDNGFAIKRNDSPGALYTQIELTERGRNLKALGSLDAFSNKVFQDQAALQFAADLKRTETERNKFQFYISVSLGISTGVAAIYYLFALTDFFQQHSVNWQHVAYLLVGICIGLCIGLLLPRFISMLKNPNRR